MQDIRNMRSEKISRGKRVVIPARTAQLETYDPIENAEEILTALLNTGRLMKDFYS